MRGVQHFFTEATSAIPSGTHQARIEFAYDGGRLGKGGGVSLYIDGKKVGVGRVELTQAMIFSADETCDLGINNASPVSPNYNPKEVPSMARSTGCRLTLGTMISTT